MPVILAGKDQDVFSMAKMVDDVVDVCLVRIALVPQPLVCATSVFVS